MTGNEAVRLPTPLELIKRYPLTKEAVRATSSMRQGLRQLFRGIDNRLAVIIGPCSLDDSGAIFDFAKDITIFIKQNGLNERLLVVFRAPPAKPRSEGGWHGLEQDSASKAREILTELVNAGYPIALEATKPVHFARYSDLASLMWVGARTASDSALRLSASTHPEVPVLFKNAEDGSIDTAVRAMAVASRQNENAHYVGPDGLEWSMPKSPGNEPAAIILRGGKKTHNITRGAIKEAVRLMKEKDIVERGVVIDISHRNSAAFNPPDDKKSADGQLPALQEVIKLLGNVQIKPHIKGVMIEAYNGSSRTDPTVEPQIAKDMLNRLASSHNI